MAFYIHCSFIKEEREFHEIMVTINIKNECCSGYLKNILLLAIVQNKMELFIGTYLAPRLRRIKQKKLH